MGISKLIAFPIEDFLFDDGKSENIMYSTEFSTDSANFTIAIDTTLRNLGIDDRHAFG